VLVMNIISSLKEYCFLIVAYSVQMEFTPSQSIVYLFQISEQDFKRQITRLNLGLFNSHWNSWGRRHKKLSPGNLLKNYSFFSLLVQFKTRRISFLKMISEIDRGNHSFFRDYVIFSKLLFLWRRWKKEMHKRINDRNRKRIKTRKKWWKIQTEKKN
jgi:hypothetical protein